MEKLKRNESWEVTLVARNESIVAGLIAKNALREVWKWSDPNVVPCWPELSIFVKDSL